MLPITMIFAGLAAAIHVYIFILESLRWDLPATRKAFGIESDAEAASTKPMAFNQGFYNLFLAIMVVGGMAFSLLGNTTVGATLLFAGAGSMVAAGFVLLLSSPTLAKAAFIQFSPPAMAIIFGILALAG
ncbi:DUF1304 domain-containing protein [Paeniglutamicibacter sp. R2-26]|uniref:DUF1304 domain-containing protein n=1 Tax=Paeniglutamicibacter sp. R2-26 TaxID=3144417 RepID=UPI003EE760DD